MASESGVCSDARALTTTTRASELVAGRPFPGLVVATVSGQEKLLQVRSAIVLFYRGYW